MKNKRKIFNDPVYGIIDIPFDILYDIIEHPFFQRLRRIKQLGMADYVYPGAIHTRFHHAIGATHLMNMAIDTLKSKNIEISIEEHEAALIAILLHDIGHGPFSHVLESTILNHVHHESMSLMLMKELNKVFDGKLDLAIQIFTNQYPRKFFNQLVSGQLDVDRLDYLNRDSYFTGVSEGIVGFERIIKMIQVVDDQIVIAEKGIYSLENFLSARRLMYWQVYLHKTSICAEEMLILIVKRAKQLIVEGSKDLFSTPNFAVFLHKSITLQDFETNPDLLICFSKIDDYDLWACIKVWQDDDDLILSRLCQMLLNRELYKVKISSVPIQKEILEKIENDILENTSISKDNLSYLRIIGSLSNHAYLFSEKSIQILRNDGSIVDISDASDLPTIKALSMSVTKYFVCYPIDFKNFN